MDEELPTEFDLIVVGTGFTESIIAAAASRIGKTVLHLDANDFYGAYWASFNLENIQNLPDLSELTNLTPNKLVENSISLDDNVCRLKDIVQKWWIQDDQEENAEKENTWTKSKIQTEFRRFNIDITPKLLFSRGDLVELLIASNICRYAEFRAVDHVTTLIENQLKSVPCSRSDVFTTKDVNVVEKRLLMKLLSSCLNYTEENDDFKDYKDTTFHNYLKEKKLTPSIIHYVMYAISMSDENTMCHDGVLSTKKFLSSLGRYGNTPFLFPMYGCGEIPQCFCRLCAVFGGVYCLKRGIKKINFTESEGEGEQKLIFKSIQCEQQEIKANNIVFGHGNLNGVSLIGKPIESTTSPKCGNLSRGVFLTDTPIGDETLNQGGGGVVFLKIPSETDGAYVIQLSHYSGTCPKGLYLIHITCKRMENAETDLKPYTEKLFQNYEFSNEENTENIETTEQNDAKEFKKKSKIFWSMYFNIPACIKCDRSTETQMDGLHLACGPYFELDYDQSIAEARDLFKRIYPNDEFLPRAPDPEEIIIGDEDGVEGDGDCGDGSDGVFDTKQLQEIIKEKISDVMEQIENEEKCMKENNLNEEKLTD